MSSLCIAYFAGAVSVAAALYSAGNRPLAGMFLLGLLTAAVAIAGALSSAARIKQAAGILSAIASAIESRRRPSAPPKAARPVERAETPNPAPRPTRKADPAETQLEKDLISALVNMGETKHRARTAAKTALLLHPAATFDQLFRAVTKPAAQEIRDLLNHSRTLGVTIQ